MRHKARLSVGAIALATLFAATAVDTAEATHWRGGNIAWTQGDGNTINFVVTTYWRRSYPFSVGSNGNLGDAVNTDIMFNFGDSSSSALTGTITTLNTTNDWFRVSSSLAHTYANAGTFKANLLDCCRIVNPPHVNNPDENFRIQSTVTVGGTDNSPNVGGSSPIFLVPDGGVQTFNPFTLTDPDGGTHTFALATGFQASGLSSGTGSFQQPAGLSINPTNGEVTWDTDVPPTTVGQLYSVSFLVTDQTGNTAPLDILLEVCAPTAPNCGGFEPPDPVPEPGTLSLITLGLLGTAELVRRRRRKA
jgi:hypothetical protein